MNNKTRFRLLEDNFLRRQFRTGTAERALVLELPRITLSKAQTARFIAQPGREKALRPAFSRPGNVDTYSLHLGNSTGWWWGKVGGGGGVEKCILSR